MCLSLFTSAESISEEVLISIIDTLLERNNARGMELL